MDIYHLFVNIRIIQTELIPRAYFKTINGEHGYTRWKYYGVVEPMEFSTAYLMIS